MFNTAFGSTNKMSAKFSRNVSVNMSASDSYLESLEADRGDLAQSKVPETVVLEQAKDDNAPVNGNGLDAKPTKYAWSVLWTIFAVRAIH